MPVKVTSNPALVARLQPLLPAGVTLSAAADGFRNQGQFIAALHVSNNLGIPFSQLKAAMTGPAHESLGQAIQTLRPGTSVQTVTRVAERQAKVDVKITKSARRDRVGDNR